MAITWTVVSELTDRFVQTVFVAFSTILAGFYSRFYCLIVSLLFDSPDHFSYMIESSEKVLQNLSLSQYRFTAESLVHPKIKNTFLTMLSHQISSTSSKGQATYLVPGVIFHLIHHHRRRQEPNQPEKIVVRDRARTGVGFP